jgi:hypothetical protein
VLCQTNMFAFDRVSTTKDMYSGWNMLIILLHRTIERERERMDSVGHEKECVSIVSSRWMYVFLFGHSLIDESSIGSCEWVRKKKRERGGGGGGGASKNEEENNDPRMNCYDYTCCCCGYEWIKEWTHMYSNEIERSESWRFFIVKRQKWSNWIKWKITSSNNAINART